MSFVTISYNIGKNVQKCANLCKNVQICAKMCKFIFSFIIFGLLRERPIV